MGLPVLRSVAVIKMSNYRLLFSLPPIRISNRGHCPNRTKCVIWHPAHPVTSVNVEETSRTRNTTRIRHVCRTLQPLRFHRIPIYQLLHVLHFHQPVPMLWSRLLNMPMCFIRIRATPVNESAFTTLRTTENDAKTMMMMKMMMRSGDRDTTHWIWFDSYWSVAIISAAWFTLAVAGHSGRFIT